MAFNDGGPRRRSSKLHPLLSQYATAVAQFATHPSGRHRRATTSMATYLKDLRYVQYCFWST